MTPQELLLNALKQRTEKYQAEINRCKTEFSEEAVHDLRVAARRLLALVDLLRMLSAQMKMLRLLKKLRNAFKKQLDSLDDLRDTQVMLLGLSKTQEILPELAHFQAALQKREQGLLGRAQVDVEKFQLDKIFQRIEALQVSLQAPAFGQELEAHILEGVDDIYFSIKRRMSKVDAAQPATIHRVRIAFKKFRYVIEIIHPLLPDFPESQFERMHDYQSAMGDIQDAEVLLTALETYSAKHKHFDALRVMTYYEDRHTGLIREYVDNMGEFFTFWKNT